MLALNGHNISKAKTDLYTVTVDRMPYGYSLLNPLYGTRTFPGYVLIRIMTPNGVVRSSYGISNDSFYPSVAMITETESGGIRIGMNDGMAVSCVFDNTKITWTRVMK